MHRNEALVIFKEKENLPNEIATARPLYTGAYNAIFRGERPFLRAFSISTSGSEELAEPAMSLDGTVIFLPYQLRLTRIGGLGSCRIVKGDAEDAEESNSFRFWSAGRGVGSGCATKDLRFI